MKILITGGTGFLGRRIVSELAEPPRAAPPGAPRLLARALPRGRRVRRGRRHRPPQPGPRHGRVRRRGPRRGAGQDPRSARRSSTASTSAAWRTSSPRPRQAGSVERVLYVSSFIALGPTEAARRRARRVRRAARPRLDQRLRAHQDPLRPRAPARRSPTARRSASSIPGVIYGPGEMTEGNIVVRHILDLVHGRLPALLGKPERRWNYVYVDDVARGVALRPEKRPAGRPLRAGRRERHARRVLRPRRQG